jgi:hypothetical protein
VWLLKPNGGSTGDESPFRSIPLPLANNSTASLPEGCKSPRSVQPRWYALQVPEATQTARLAGAPKDSRSAGRLRQPHVRRRGGRGLVLGAQLRKSGATPADHSSSGEGDRALRRRPPRIRRDSFVAIAIVSRDAAQRSKLASMSRAGCYLRVSDRLWRGANHGRSVWIGPDPGGADGRGSLVEGGRVDEKASFGGGEGRYGRKTGVICPGDVVGDRSPWLLAGRRTALMPPLSSL